MYIPEKKLITQVEKEFRSRIPFLSRWKIEYEKKVNGLKADMVITARYKEEIYYFCVEIKRVGYPQYVREAVYSLQELVKHNPAYYPVIVKVKEARFNDISQEWLFTTEKLRKFLRPAVYGKLAAVADGYDIPDSWVVRVIPKGQRVPRAELDEAIREGAARTTNWVLKHEDEMQGYLAKALSVNDPQWAARINNELRATHDWLVNAGFRADPDPTLTGLQPDKIWYFNSRQTIFNKMGRRPTANTSEVRQWISKISKDERYWLGLDVWLEANPNAKFTR